MRSKLWSRFLLACLGIRVAGGFIIRNASQTIDSGAWEPLAEAPSFYTRSDYEGWTTLGYSNHWWRQPKTLIGGASNWRLENGQLVGEDVENSSQVVINAAAGSIEEVEASIVIVEIKER